MCHHRHTRKTFKTYFLINWVLGMRNISRKMMLQEISLYLSAVESRGWSVRVLDLDVSLRHDLVTPLLRVICQGVFRHPQTFNVRAWLERKAARVFRGRSCTKRPCTPGMGHFSQCWAQQRKAIVQAHRTRAHSQLNPSIPAWTLSIWTHSLNTPPSGHVID